MTWSDTRLVSQNLSSFRIEVADDFPRLDEVADSSDHAETMPRIFRLHFIFFFKGYSRVTRLSLISVASALP